MRRFLLMLLACGLLQSCATVFFQPQRALVMTPDRLGLDYQDVYIDTPDGVRLHAWYLPAQGEARGTVLFLHGNAENISTHIASIYWLPERQYHVLLLDYRGYGRSAGAPMLDGMVLDVEAALAWLATRPEVEKHGMVVFGQSLGGALAVYAVAHSAHRDRIKALIIDSAFSDYRAIVREKLAEFWLTWPMQWPLSLTVDERYSPLRAVADISPTPLLIIHGEHDSIVPMHHAERLYAGANEPKTLWRIAEAGHIQALTRPEQRRRLADYLDRVFGKCIPDFTGEHCLPI